MLAIDGLTGGWGPTTIVENLNLTIAAGEVVAIVGRNGVGKTTLLELITGRARRTRGRISLGGQPIDELPTYERARLGLGYVPQAREVFPSLTLEENLPWRRAPVNGRFIVSLTCSHLWPKGGKASDRNCQGASNKCSRSPGRS